MTDYTGSWQGAVEAVIGGAPDVSCMGRVFTRKEVLAALGYDEASRLGLRDEYKRVVLQV